MIKRNVLMNVTPSPKELAYCFCNMSSKDQAEVFNKIGSITGTGAWAKDFAFQLEAVSREEDLTQEGRHVMEQIGGYSQRTEFPPIKVNTKRGNTFCPECGFGVGIDEDGCCGCGALAVGNAVEELYNNPEYAAILEAV